MSLGKLVWGTVSDLDAPKVAEGLGEAGENNEEEGNLADRAAREFSRRSLVLRFVRSLAYVLREIKTNPRITTNITPKSNSQ